MPTGPGPHLRVFFFMVISFHGEVRSRPWLPVRVQRLSAVPWVMLRVNCYASDHFNANYACLKVVLCHYLYCDNQAATQIANNPIFLACLARCL